jgi:hypothetical protein
MRSEIEFEDMDIMEEVACRATNPPPEGATFCEFEAAEWLPEAVGVTDPAEIAARLKQAGRVNPKGATTSVVPTAGMTPPPPGPPAVSAGVLQGLALGAGTAPVAVAAAVGAMVGAMVGAFAGASVAGAIAATRKDAESDTKAQPPKED